jgi:hypothetical protein
VCFGAFEGEVNLPIEPVPGKIVSDYLNNLVARSLNPAPALQPRSRSHFEPAPSGGSLVAAQPLAAALEIWSEATPVVSRRAPRRRSWESVAAPSEPIDVSPGALKIENDPPAVRRSYFTESASPSPSPWLDGDHAGERAGQAAIGADEISMALRTAQPLLTIRPPGPLPSLQAPVPASAANPRGAAAPVVEGRGGIVRPLAEAVEPGRPGPMPGSPPRRNGDQGAIPALTQATEVMIREQTAGTEALKPRLHGPRSATSLAIETGQPAPEREPAVIVRPQATPIFEDQGRSPFEGGASRQAPAVPSVHVTIGRIEVRATPAPSTTTPRAAQPTMSLDDYLRRRGNGGAR